VLRDRSSVRAERLVREDNVLLHSIDLKSAEKIVDAAIAKGRELGFEPLTVVVLDDSGTVKAMKREDGSSLMRPDIAAGKAWGCLGFGFGTRVVVARAQSHPMFINALTDMSGGRIVPSPGGVLIKNAEGRTIGAIGISGDTGDNDEICAVAGIEAAGLTPDTGA
jgi:uncharacterized protein GlcG (DUF336 family)